MSTDVRCVWKATLIVNRNMAAAGTNSTAEMFYWVRICVIEERT